MIVFEFVVCTDLILVYLRARVCCPWARRETRMARWWEGVRSSSWGTYSRVQISLSSSDHF